MNRLSLKNKRLKFIQDYRKFTDHFRGIYRIYPNSVKDNWRMSTCNRLDLQTLGSQTVMMPKNLPDHCSGPIWGIFQKCFFIYLFFFKMGDFLSWNLELQSVVFQTRLIQFSPFIACAFLTVNNNNNNTNNETLPQTLCTTVLSSLPS